MSRTLKISILIFALVDIILLALYFFGPTLPNFMSFRRHKEITFSSDIPSLSVKPTNASFLNSKLEELDFWGEKKVALFDPNGKQYSDLITVKSLAIYLTPQSQILGAFASTESGKTYIYQSFGMKYDVKTRHLDLYLYVLPDIIAKEMPEDLATRYSGLLLASVFDITHPIPQIHHNKDFEELTGQIDFIKTINNAPNKTVMIINK